MCSHEAGDVGRRHALRSQLVGEDDETLKRRNVKGAKRVIQEGRTPEVYQALANRILENRRKAP